MNKKLKTLVFPKTPENYEKLKKLFPGGYYQNYTYQNVLEPAEMDFLLENPLARILKMWRKHGRSGISIMTVSGIAKIPLVEAKKALREMTEPGYCSSTGLPVYSYCYPTFRDWPDFTARGRETRILAAFSRGWRTWANRFFYIPGYRGVVGAKVWHDLRRAYFLEPRLARAKDPLRLPAALLKRRWHSTPDDFPEEY